MGYVNFTFESRDTDNIGNNSRNSVQMLNFNCINKYDAHPRVISQLVRVVVLESFNTAQEAKTPT